MRFRRTHPGEPGILDAVLALHRQIGWTDGATGKEIWIAEDLDGDVVGEAGLIDVGGGRTVVFTLAVREDLRRRGIGSALMRAVLGSRETEWWTETGSDRVGFYERLGFAITPAGSLPPEVAPVIDHPSPRQPDRQLNFLKRAPLGVEVRAARPEDGAIALDQRRETDWTDDRLEGELLMGWLAGEDEPVGSFQLIEIEPGRKLVDGVVVRERVRGRGVGARMLSDALGARQDAEWWLLCHEDRVAFYERSGFEAVDPDEMPETVRARFVADGELPTDPGHVHIFMRREGAVG